MIRIYTDGAAKGNPGNGGYGAILDYQGQRKELAKGFRMTTNNRMELLAVIVGLEAIKKPGWEVEVISDSKYVVDAVEKGWLKNWIKKAFKGKKKIDLWKRYLDAAKTHKVRFKWIKGHAGHLENERCDYLAVRAAEGDHLLIDHAFEETRNAQ